MANMRNNKLVLSFLVLLAFQTCANATWFLPFPFPWGNVPNRDFRLGNGDFSPRGNHFFLGRQWRFPHTQLHNNPGQVNQGSFPDPPTNPGQVNQGGIPDQGNNPGQVPDQDNGPSHFSQDGWPFGVNGDESLKLGFYNTTCPNAEKIVRDIFILHFKKDPAIAAGIVRMFFHDCFVRGCDASLLLERTMANDLVEKAAGANSFTLKGEEVIDAIKSALELACPGIVSCADILSFTVRDAVVMAGLRDFAIPGGRRDGTVSMASEVSTNLPSPLMSVNELTQMFKNKGFDQAEMVILSGAHSIGGAHCFTFVDRLYSNKPTSQMLDTGMADNLKRSCPIPQADTDISKDAKVDFDPSTPVLLDASYYARVLRGKGLLSSDHVLMSSRRTRTIVGRMAANPDKWKRKFTKAMIKLSKVDVLVGDQGEIRKQCRSVNGI